VKHSTGYSIHCTVVQFQWYSTAIEAAKAVRNAAMMKTAVCYYYYCRISEGGFSAVYVREVAVRITEVIDLAIYEKETLTGGLRC
jgi:hypothetical protein